MPFILLAFLQCGEGNQESASLNSTTDKGALGQMVYRENCISCHGANGKLGLNGAKDLTQSELTLTERKNIIVNGKNTMTPFKHVLSEEEIKAVARYTLKLSNPDE